MHKILLLWKWFTERKNIMIDKENIVQISFNTHPLEGSKSHTISTHPINDRSSNKKFQRRLNNDITPICIKRTNTTFCTMYHDWAGSRLSQWACTAISKTSHSNNSQRYCIFKNENITVIKMWTSKLTFWISRDLLLIFEEDLEGFSKLANTNMPKKIIAAIIQWVVYLSSQYYAEGLMTAQTPSNIGRIYCHL